MADAPEWVRKNPANVMRSSNIAPATNIGLMPEPVRRSYPSQPMMTQGPIEAEQKRHSDEVRRLEQAMLEMKVRSLTLDLEQLNGKISALTKEISSSGPTAGRKGVRERDLTEPAEPSKAARHYPQEGAVRRGEFVATRERTKPKTDRGSQLTGDRRLGYVHPAESAMADGAGDGKVVRPGHRILTNTHQPYENDHNTALYGRNTQCSSGHQVRGKCCESLLRAAWSDVKRRTEQRDNAVRELSLVKQQLNQSSKEYNLLKKKYDEQNKAPSNHLHYGPSGGQHSAAHPVRGKCCESVLRAAWEDVKSHREQRDRAVGELSLVKQQLGLACKENNLLKKKYDLQTLRFEKSRAVAELESQEAVAQLKRKNEQLKVRLGLLAKIENCAVQQAAKPSEKPMIDEGPRMMISKPCTGPVVHRRSSSQSTLPSAGEAAKETLPTLVLRSVVEMAVDRKGDDANEDARVTIDEADEPVVDVQQQQQQQKDHCPVQKQQQQHHGLMKTSSIGLPGNVFSSLEILKRSAGTINLLVGCYDRSVHCVEYRPQRRDVLERKWKVEMQSQIYATPLIVGRYMVVCTTSGYINLVDLANEDTGGGEGAKIVSTLQMNGELFAAPVAHGKALFVGCRDNCLYKILLDV